MSEDKGAVDFDGMASRRGTRRQQRGRAIVAALYMLVRNVKLHAPDNTIFLKPIESLREAINTVIAAERAFDLQAVDTHIFLNQTQLKFDFASLESVTYLSSELQARNVGGFYTKRPVTTQEIRDFLRLFGGDYRGSIPDDSDGDQPLPSIRFKRYAHVKELLDKILETKTDLDEKIDRKKYLMTVYARAVFFMRRYFAAVAEGDFSIPISKSGRLVQDLVDLSFDQRIHFLGMTTNKSESDYLPYHSVNCCLLSIVFGQELGLDKRQVHDIGMAALFSQMGLTSIPERILVRKGGLSEEERALVDLYPLRSAKLILRARGLDRTSMRRIVATYESRVDFAIPRKLSTGDIELVTPKMGLGINGKIIAIVDCYDALTSKRPFREPYGPEIALALMIGELRYKFDPVLLRIFMKVMAIQPIKILEDGPSTLRIR